MERLWESEMAHLLIVTLGPIQDLIAAARRTRDLWFGSWLLSELSKATAQAMARECGPESLVFPGVSNFSELGPGTGTSVANKIVVRVPDGKDPAAVAKRGGDGMRARLDEIRKEAFAKIRPLHPRHFDQPAAEAQVADLIEFTWVTAPEPGEKGYGGARRRAESLLAARKNTRLWSQVSWGAQVPKSSIDGERESVLHEDLFDGVIKKEISPEDVRKRYGVGPKERLCGVGLLKRHGTHPSKKYGHRFISTGHLAAWPIHYRTKGLDDPPLKEAWGKYLHALEEGGIQLEEQEVVQGPGWRHPIFGPYDGSLLFENRLPELFEEVTDPERRKEGLRTARLALAEFLKKLGVSTPLPYYAILVADGDRMGKAIERQETFEMHQRLSGKLDQFAQSVRSTVEGDYAGELVYSGGDDVLAFVPLHHAVACARKLAADFKEQLAGFPAGEDGQTPTLSAGIGVSHFMDPLRGALRLARKAEGLAKEKRNSLAIIVDKRSGPPVAVSGVWGTLDKRLTDYVIVHREDKVPDGAAYELEELARLLDGVDGEERSNLEKLVRKEAERILRRKQPGHGEETEIDKKVLGSLLADLDEPSDAELGKREESTLKKVANRLIVARLFAQASEQAGEKLTPEEAGGQP
jgi:CRISPR-associated protein Cmr2